MKIEPFHHPQEQWIYIDGQGWSVAKLIGIVQLQNLPVMEIPLDHLYIHAKYEKITLREMVTHIKAVLAADMNQPIILDEDGDILDGRHRIMRALLEDHHTIKAVRFEKNPTPCKECE